MADITVGELIYDYTVEVKKVIEFCPNMEDVLAGKASPPAQGARRDIFFEGTVNGPKIYGTIAGIDYMNIRADGKRELHIHAAITTNDGATIALEADGVGAQGREAGQPTLLENVQMVSAHPSYTWVNGLQIWTQGTSPPVNLKGYAA